MKKLLIILSPILAVLAVASIFLHSGAAHAASFNQNDLMDDPIFTNTNTMSAGQIDSWLDANFPSSCISTNNGFTAPDPTGYSPTGGFTYGGNATAGQVIYDAAQAYGINPQVLLVTLQKEQSLVSGGSGCSVLAYTGAMGYGCPDGGTTHSYSGVDLYSINGSEVSSVSGTCVSSVAQAGFSQQVIHAAWLLMFGEQRSKGNVSWNVQKTNSPESGDVWNNSDDPQTCYGGPMTEGTWSTCPNSSPVFYDGSYTIDGTSIQITTGATAALYWYTPHFAGNQNFDNIFTTWFGLPTSIASGITMHNITQPDATPALGETITYTISLTNNFSQSITLDAVGIVGRLNSLTGANRDLGWQGPVTINAGATQQYTFTSVVHDQGTIYVWPAIFVQGGYTQYNNWGAALTTHIPNLSLVSPFTSSITNPVAGQTATLSATVKNNESKPILLDAIGIPVRFFGQYNYDTGWMSAVTIQPGATQAVSGTVPFDKAGPYTTWLSAQFGGQYVTYSPVMTLNASVPVPNFQLSYTTTPDTTPALGQDVTIAFSLKNNSGVPMILNAVGVVGRYDNPYTGANSDFGWVGPETFSAGQQKSYSFTANISALRNLYAWPAINYQGTYTHYNNWGFLLTPHLPDLTLSSPLTINGGTQPTLGHAVTVTATIKNNEPNPVKFSAIGIPARYYGVYNYDAVWQGAGTLAASGQSGDSMPLTGTITFDKTGPYTVWSSIYIQGRFITLGNVQNVNL